MRYNRSFIKNEDADTSAQAIADNTVREPVLVPTQGPHVLAANRSNLARTATQDRLSWALGEGQCDTPKLRFVLDLLRAKDARLREKDARLREKDARLREQDVLLKEMQHRVANSLQIVAAIILMKSKSATSEETRLHLRDAYSRVMSIGAVQQHLDISGTAAHIEMVPYIAKLCAILTISMIGAGRPIALNVSGDAGSVSSREATSLGLIITELVLNALKHAFPDDKIDGQITVRFDVAGTNWQLSIADNGIGKPAGASVQEKIGHGTAIVKALAGQLDAQVDVVSGPRGTTVSVTHAPLAKMPQAKWQGANLAALNWYPAASRR